MIPLTKTNDWPPLAVFDIEAEQWVNVLLVCHVDESGNRKAFRNIRAYLNWLFSDAFTGDYVWAHWGGHYDHRFIIHEATIRQWEWETLQSGGAIICTIVRHEKRTIRFCDSSRLMPDSVAKIGKTIGLDKLDVDRSDLGSLSMKEMITYCFRDCDIVLQGLQHMRRVLTKAGADFSITLASIAARWCRRNAPIVWERLVEGEKPAPTTTQIMADHYALDAYFGGRVECFRMGHTETTLYYYDIRSSYPWSMTQSLPLYVSRFNGPDDSPDFEREGVSEVTITVPRSEYLPVLPLRRKGKVIFPVGTMRGKWTNVEIRAALARGGTVLAFHGQLLFDTARFTLSFVNTFFGLRSEAIEARDQFASYTYKILLNSLYGKLVETTERRSVIYGRRNLALARRSGHVIVPLAALGVYGVEREEMGPFRLSVAAAYVTAYSRLRLHGFLSMVREKGGECIYCDTDSVITDVELPTGEALGDLKLEDVLSSVDILSPKVYRCITQDGTHFYKVKGMNLRAGDAAENERRWQTMVKGGAVNKEGISGFMSDLRRGRVSPERFELSRTLRSLDTKRMHREHDSVPVEV